MCSRRPSRGASCSRLVTESMHRAVASVGCFTVPVGHGWLSRTLIADALTEQWHQTDALGLTCRMVMGFLLRNDALLPYKDNPRSFGHVGLGGVLSCGDPDAKLGFSFCGNRMATSVSVPMQAVCSKLPWRRSEQPGSRGAAGSSACGRGCRSNS
jgi:hypothetical protein